MVTHPDKWEETCKKQTERAFQVMAAACQFLCPNLCFAATSLVPTKSSVEINLWHLVRVVQAVQEAYMKLRDQQRLADLMAQRALRREQQGQAGPTTEARKLQQKFERRFDFLREVAAMMLETNQAICSVLTWLRSINGGADVDLSMRGARRGSGAEDMATLEILDRVDCDDVALLDRIIAMFSSTQQRSQSRPLLGVDAMIDAWREVRKQQQ